MAVEHAYHGFGDLEHPAFAHPLLEGADRARVLPVLLAASLERYAAGETVLRPAPGREAVILVLTGRLRVFELSREGRRLILDQVESGGVDGILLAAGLRGHFSEAIEPTLVLAVDMELLPRLVEAEPAVAVNLLRLAGRRLQQLEDHLQRLTLRDPGRRLAGQLLALSLAAGDGKEAGADTRALPRISHETLADMVGLRRETVTLHLGRLRRGGALRVSGDHFFINRPALEAIRDGGKHRPA